MTAFVRDQLTQWGPPLLPGVGAHDLETLWAAWRAYGDEIMRQHIADRPGTRPYACYVLGIVPLPPIRSGVPADVVHRIGGREIHSRTTYFGELVDGWRWAKHDENELAYLLTLGVATRSEAAACRRRAA